jgi:MFS transporter, OFA family, oxalate/formate antiporter
LIYYPIISEVYDMRRDHMNKNESNGTSRNLVLAACMLIQLCAGVIYMWSVFKGPVTAYLGLEASALSMVSSVMLALFVIGILVGGNMLDRLGPRIVCVIGCIVMSVGILASAFATPGSAMVIYVMYGAVGGFGVGMAYTCTVSVVQKWFFDRRGFATGMLVGAFGFSLVLFSPLANGLLQSAGVPMTFMVFGIAFLAICTVAALFVKAPPEGYTVSGASKNVASSQRQYTTPEMLRTKSFYFIIVSLFLSISVFFVLNPHLMDLGIDRGLNQDLAVMGVMIVGACNAFGRVALTWVSDRIGRHEALLLSVGITTAGAVAMIFARDVAFLASLAAIAFAFGGLSGLYTTLTADHFGTVNMGSNYGLVMMGFLASALMFPFVSNMMVGNTGDYTGTFIMLIIAGIAAMLLIMALRKQHDQATA